MTATQWPTGPQLPALHRSFDQASARQQKRFVRLTRTSLLATVAAAAAGAVSIGDGPDWAAAVALAAFALAAGCRLLLLQDRPERAWYDARAGAESVKTLAWQYAVGATPFSVGGPDDEHRGRLAERLREIVYATPALRIAPAAGSQEITDWMRDLRGAPLADRRQAYLDARIVDQITWYSAAADRNDRHARRWAQLTVSLQGLGVLAALLRVTGTIDVDLIGIAAAAAAATTAWLEAKDHSGLAEAYATTAHELALVRDMLPDGDDEPRWAAFVADAESAISREHTSWLARRRSTVPRASIL